VRQSWRIRRGGLGLARRGRDRTIIMAVSLSALLTIWHLVTETGLVSGFLLPAPAEVADAFNEQRQPIFSALLVTLVEVSIGFTGAVVLGILTGLGLTYSRTFNAAVFPPLLMLNNVPKTAIAPLLLIWLGFGMMHKIVLSMTLAFFPILVSTVSGLRAVDPDLHDLARSMHASWGRTFWKIDLPYALPYLFSGFRASIHLSVTGAIIAEFVSGGDGLAFLLHSASSNFQLDLAFAVAIVISLLSTLLFGLVVLVERIAIPWAPPTNET